MAMSRCSRGVGLLSATAVAAVASAAELNPADHLADQFTINAGLILEAEPITAEAVRSALLLTEEAVKLSPDNTDLWRRVLRLADMLEREDLRVEAIDRIGRLDPKDEVIRLRRLGVAIDEKQTVQERIEAYELLLSPDHLQQIGGPTASRLALDLALLHQRRGDEFGFSRWLGEAVALDPGNRAAAALAAGYYPTRVDDVLGHAELLVNLVLADPANTSTQVDLGRLLLEHGAYVGAERMLRIASQPHMVGGVPPGSDIFADHAVSQWASGQPEAALAVIAEQQRYTDEVVRLAAKQTDPTLGPLELARLTAPISPTQATVRAAILCRLKSQDAPAALIEAIASYDRAIEEAGADARAQTLAQLHLEKAWVVAWLGGDPVIVEQSIQAAGDLVSLSEQAKQRFAGWLALNRGDLDQAVADLAPLASEDVPARLGLAMAQLMMGSSGQSRQDAAVNLLAVARDRPGSMMSVWAADYLFAVLGRRVPITNEAGRLEQLLASIPSVFDRYSVDPTLCVALRVSPTRSTFAPYEPIIVNVEIANNSLYPIAIDRDGPIRPQVVLMISVRISQVTELGDLKPVVIDIDRRLTLAPKERLVIPVDLRRHRLGAILNQLPLPGAIVRVLAVSNFFATPAGAIVPGLLGAQAESPPFRVDGVRVSRTLMERSMADVLAADELQRVELMAILTHIAAGGYAATLSAEDRVLLDDVLSAVIEAYPDLDPVSQAWLIGVMAQGPTSQAIRSMARKSDNRLVKISYLFHCVDGVDDPMLDAARRDEDPVVRELADLSEKLLAMGEAQRRPAAPSTAGPPKR